MEPNGNSGRPKEQPAQKSGGASKRNVSPSAKQRTATQPIQQDKSGQQGDPDRARSVMSLADDEAGSSDFDVQAIPATAISENADERHQKISAAAYARAERRGFEPGKEQDDWLSAEAELYGGYTRDGEEQEEKPEQQRDQNEVSKNYNAL